MKSSKPTAVIIVDTREQKAYDFSGIRRRDLAWGGVRREALESGDYSIELDGETLPILIERKSIGDLFGVVGQGRERFEREMERIHGSAERGYIVIEATAEEVRKGYERSAVSGEAALGSLLHWSTVFGVHPLFCSNRVIGKRVVQGLLEDFAAHWMRTP